MPEGPSIVILREQAAVFTGQAIERAQGSAKLDKTRLVGQSVRSFRSWGKHFLIELEDVSLRVHTASSSCSTSAKARSRRTGWPTARPPACAAGFRWSG